MITQHQSFPSNFVVASIAEEKALGIWSGGSKLNGAGRNGRFCKIVLFGNYMAASFLTAAGYGGSGLSWFDCHWHQRAAKLSARLVHHDFGLPDRARSSQCANHIGHSESMGNRDFVMSIT